MCFRKQQQSVKVGIAVRLIKERSFRSALPQNQQWNEAMCTTYPTADITKDTPASSIEQYYVQITDKWQKGDKFWEQLRKTIHGVNLENAQEIYAKLMETNGEYYSTIVMEEKIFPVANGNA